MKVCSTGCSGDLPNTMNFCPNCGSPAVIKADPIQQIVYMKGNSDSFHEKGVEIGLEGSTLEEFSYTLRELGLLIEIDPTTGKTILLGVENPQDPNEISFLSKQLDVS